MSVYSEIADALDSMADSSEQHDVNPPHHAVSAMLEVSIRAYAYLETIPQVDVDFATPLIKGERYVAIPGRFSPTKAHERPEPIVLPDLRAPEDYVYAPCKHEFAILNQSRHMRQAHDIWLKDRDVQRALMLSRSRLCGVETAKTNLAVVQDVATMDRPSNYEHLDLIETTLYTASRLNLPGMPYDFDALRVDDPPS